jgi:hypothetical protein
MTRFFKFPFPFLDSLKYRLLHVFIILVFSVLFLIVFEPFNIKAWLKYPEWLKDLGLLSLGLTFSFIIAFSQLLIRTVVKVKKFKVYHLLVWLTAEILLLTVILTIIFADYTNGFMKEFFITLRFASVGLVLPYSFSILILMLIQQNNSQEHSLSKSPPEKSDLIHIKDERQQVKFSIQKSSVLYLESSDNYVTIFYLQEDHVKKEMVRNSMKKMEKQLQSSGLIRCHRSFIVNMENVHWFKKEGRNYLFKMKHGDTIIPVSRAFIPAIKSLIQD